MTRKAYNPWLHRYAVGVAFATFLLVIAGALVTSNDAALSVPSWPAPLHWPSAMGPGGHYELGHRFVAGAVSALTIILALWLWRADSRRWVRRLGGVAVLVILGQAILGGITVVYGLPVAVSVGHACLGQLVFCVAVCLALFTGEKWRWEELKTVDFSLPSLRRLAAGTTGLVFLQLMVGAAFRHNGFGIVPHLIGAVLVTAGIAWIAARILSRFSGEPRLTRPALLLVGLLVAQLGLGIGSYILKLGARLAPQPLPPVVLVTTAHVAVGALVLVVSLVVTLQVFRFVEGDRLLAVEPVASSGGERLASSASSR